MKTHFRLAAMLASLALQPDEPQNSTDKMEEWRKSFFASNPEKVKEIIAQSKQKQIEKEARRIERWSGESLLVKNKIKLSNNRLT